MTKSLGDIVGLAGDRFTRTWKPLALGFGLVAVLSELPWVIIDLMSARFADTVASETSKDMLSILSAQLPTMLTMLGAVFAMLVFLVLVYNFAFALAAAAFRSAKPDDVGAVVTAAWAEFVPMMGTLGYFALGIFVPVLFALGACWRGWLAAGSSGGWGSVAVLTLLALFTLLLSTPFFYLAIAVPAASQTQGMTAFKRGLNFVGENFLEFVLVSLSLMALAILFGIVTAVLKAPLPSGTGPGLADIENDLRSAVVKMFAPEKKALWVKLTGMAIDAVVYIVRQSLAVSIVATWFAVRTGVSDPSWPQQARNP